MIMIDDVDDGGEAMEEMCISIHSPPSIHRCLVWQFGIVVLYFWLHSQLVSGLLLPRDTTI
jgi:hypothetical protein